MSCPTRTALRRAAVRTTASRSRPGQQVLVRSTTLAAPLLLALQRAILEREAWPLLRVELPGQDEGFWAPRARPPPRRLRPGRARRGRGRRRAAADPGARQHARAGAASTRRGIARAARARARAARGCAARRWCATLWPTPAGAQQAGMGAGRVRGVRASARCSSTATTRSPRGASCATFQARLIERLSRRARAAHRGRGHRPDACASTGRTWVNSDGKRNMPSRRGLHRPARGLSASGRSASRSRRARAASRSPGIELEFRDGAVVERPRRARRGLPAARRSPPTTAPAASARSGSARTSGSTAPIGAILFDEKIGGTVHLARRPLAIPETGGINESAVHWDMICDLRAGGRLSADGEAIVEDGRFVVAPAALVASAGRAGAGATFPLRAPHEDRRHHRPRLARRRDARADGRGGHGRRAAELLARHARAARRDRPARARAPPTARAAPVAILQDLPGPEAAHRPAARRTRRAQPGDKRDLRLRRRTRLGRRASACRSPWAGLADASTPGDVLYLADGAVRLRVSAVRAGDGEVDAEVEIGGAVASRQGLNIPGRARRAAGRARGGPRAAARRRVDRRRPRRAVVRAPRPRTSTTCASTRACR